MMESDLKRSLLKSLRASDGEGFRMEDRYALGRPDLFLSPAGLPPFLAEVKMIKGAKLICTAKQAISLERYDRPPFVHAVLIGWSASRNALYIGKPEWPLSGCRYIPRPTRLDSADWLIHELLGKWHYQDKDTAYVTAWHKDARQTLR